MSHKYVYLFSEGNANMRELLGGKGANGNDAGDGIPDRYQMAFYFQVVNGTWADGIHWYPWIYEYIYNILPDLF